MFRYSHEEGTHSHSLPSSSPRTIAERADALMEMQRSISRDKLRARVGQELEVLVEGVSDESEFLLQGRHAAKHRRSTASCC